LGALEKRLALGSYPEVNLKLARKARDDAKAQKADGRDPVQARKIAKLKETALDMDTFKVTALEWFDKHKARWSSHYAIREKRNLEKDLFPYFAARRIGDIEPVESTVE
jgi:Arm DNA-binding domain/Phage integrase, N-terminal SAM-like domain